MPRPVVCINNFVRDKNDAVQQKSKVKIDCISKFYIISELMIGVNRLPFFSLRNIFSARLIYMYKILIIILALCVIIVNYKFTYVDNLSIVDLAQLFISVALSVMSSEKLRMFYKTLNEFDEKLGYVAKNAKESLYSIAQLVITVTITLIFYFMSQRTIRLHHSLFHVMMVTLAHAVELHYQGHLLSLLIPRLTFLETYCELCFSYKENTSVDDIRYNTRKNISSSEDGNKESCIKLQKLPDYYNKLIIIFDYLYEAIKWQMLILLTVTLIITLTLSFYLSKNIITGEFTTSIFYWNISYLIIEFLPIFVPCVMANRIQTKVCQLRELLTTKLYENTLGKLDRSTVRSLHALMETRNLSFSLFNMFDIDVTLPFKFMALVITYLIIMLQFDKATMIKL